MEKECIGCGIVFNAYHPNKQKYCSIACGQRHKRELIRGKPANPKRKLNLSLKHCGECGKEFKPRDETTKYCSTSCRDIARKIIKTVIVKSKKCKNCHKEFIYNNEGSLFCSKGCKDYFGYHFPIAPGKRKGPITICEKCGVKFKAWRTDRISRFCSNECAGQRVYVSNKPKTKCETCGALFLRYGGGNDARFCSRECYLKSNPKILTSQGYILVYNKEYSDRESGQLFEHRLVMAQNLGRKLEPYETVHHINGNRQDNRVENLQLRTGKHGKGVVHQCCDCGSTNIESIHLAG